MLAQILSGAVLGVDAFLVNVEVDLARGLPCMNVVGLPESAVREGRERVMAALANSGFELPACRITVNLAPADVRKDGSAFDLPIAVGLLAAKGELPHDGVRETVFLGELGLDGELRPVRGTLPIAARCGAHGARALIVPAANAAEAAVVDTLEVRGARSLAEVVRHLRGERELRVQRADAAVGSAPAASDVDLADVRGQGSAKRALEVAAAGQHNLLMVGPPGAGKSMLARRLPGILPPLTRAEAIDVTRVYSVAGRMRPGHALVASRPFRAPHHTISDAGLIGGGPALRPGEASLAHHGVLFLDELPEFRRAVLETLRQPLEDGLIQIGRARASLTYPAQFMLVAAMNPCPCGFRFTGDGRCLCSDRTADAYAARVSAPLLDRIDLHIEVPALEERELAARAPGEPSAAVRNRVIAARERQTARLEGGRPGLHANAHLGPRELREHCQLPPDAEHLLRGAARRLGLSARGYHRVLRLARTIADLAGEDHIGRSHVGEAVQYRALENRRTAVRRSYRSESAAP